MESREGRAMESLVLPWISARAVYLNSIQHSPEPRRATWIRRSGRLSILGFVGARTRTPDVVGEQSHAGRARDRRARDASPPVEGSLAVTAQQSSRLVDETMNRAVPVPHVHGGSVITANAGAALGERYLGASRSSMVATQPSPGRLWL